MPFTQTNVEPFWVIACWNKSGPEWVLESRQEALEAVRMRDVSNVEETGMFSR